METQRLHANVIGLVQGVSFRDSTRQQAAALGLTGWVRNRPDGSVEVLAEGPRAGLDRLLAYLYTGPRLARVETVEADWPAATGEFAGFNIRY